MNFGYGYKSRAVAMSAMLAVAMVSGCAGSKFVRQETSSFVLGQTSQQDVSNRMGKPYRAGTLEKNGKMLQSATYAYASVGGEPLHRGVVPARSQGFYFLNGTLVGTEFSSSFKADGTDFDETKLPLIEKGSSTKADVINLLGAPGGESIAPLTTHPNERALTYVYSQVKGSAFNMRVYTKTLSVLYNESGVVTDVQYVAQGTKD